MGCSLGPAARLEAVRDPVIPQLGDWLRRRPDTLSLAQGMVDWAPPAAVRRAVLEALETPGAGLDRYGGTWGDPELLEAVTRQLRDNDGLDLDGSHLLVTTGSNMAFAALVQVICDPGSEVILPLPAYFNHEMAVRLAGGVPVGVEAGPVPDPEALAAAITPRSRAIVTISPNNPSGVVIPEAVLRAINTLCAARGLLHISDEAYGSFTHGTVPHFSPGRVSGAGAHTATLHSLSKTYGLAGWRMGYAAVPQVLRPALVKVLDTVQICPTLISQRAAAAALTTDPSWVRERVATLLPRRAQLLAAVEGWRQEGLPVRLWVEPEGAFYGLLVVDGLAAEDRTSGGRRRLDSDGLMEALALEEGVATVSGLAFGLAVPGAAVLRLSYGMLSGPPLVEALERLGAGLRRVCGR
ncbi:MAG: aminotransferase class I/II-fold pyridoxal phosphate-dependent enzyme [Cyanobacteria bacterium K_Offshore_surface_m2_239]|nr:aminotransferase class I/II-fold pyridoxal phosphate-dependent enzyme [Cyanobacteria bacterium K_Offshore_surface_m2_239]